MDDDVFAGLVRQREAESAHDAAAFKRRVLLVSVAAYVALALFLITTVVLLYWGFRWASHSHSIRNMILLGLFAATLVPMFWVVGKFFFMRLDPPQGREITRADAPKVFEVLDKMRRKLGGPKIHHVLIDKDYNASISQQPRFGLFGGHTNYLCLGLPYLLGTAPKEMLATIAHEYGHLCGSDGKMGAWIYRQRITFSALHERVLAGEDTSWVYATLAVGLNWFWPHYHAYTFVLSRQQEYAADHTATLLIGAGDNASGLVRDHLLGRWVDQDFWRQLYRQASTHEAPRTMPFATMKHAFVADYAQWATPERLREAMRRDSDWHNTHPCLRERLEAIGEKPGLPPPLTTAASDIFLGGFTQTLIDEFDQLWWKDEAKSWRGHHQRIQREKSELATLNGRRIETLGPSELQQLALLKSDHETVKETKPVLEYLLAKPGGPYPKAAYLFGRILLDEKNNRGLDHLEAAARNDANLAETATRIGYDYLLEHKGEAAALAWYQRVVESID